MGFKWEKTTGPFGMDFFFNSRGDCIGHTVKDSRGGTDYYVRSDSTGRNGRSGGGSSRSSSGRGSGRNGR